MSSGSGSIVAPRRKYEKEEYLMRFIVCLQLVCLCIFGFSAHTLADVPGGEPSGLLASDEQAVNDPPWDSQASEDQPLISNVFFYTDIRQAIADVAAQSGVSIIVDETVQGMITLEIVDLPLEQCLRRMLSPFGFTFRKMDGYYLVGSAYPDSPSFAALSVTEMIPLNYLRAKDAQSLLSRFYEPFIRVNAEMNALAVSASPEIIARIKEDLTKIDVPPRQVMIEAVVTEFSENARKELGMDYSWLGVKDGKSWNIIAPFASLLDTALNVAVPQDELGVVHVRPGTYKGWSYGFMGGLRAMIDDGKIKIRANPRIATIEGQKATIFIGQEEYYILYTPGVTYAYGQLERILVGVSLTITPFISQQGEITVEIEPEVSDVVGVGTTDLPVVNKRTVKTKVRVREGETIIIGGLLQKNEVTRGWKIPILGQIPILGYLFSHTSKVTEENEVVVFITPHILTEGEESEEASQ
jgi:type II secretory pathway component GspD/PulD (secretin)